MNYSSLIGTFKLCGLNFIKMVVGEGNFNFMTTPILNPRSKIERANPHFKGPVDSRMVLYNILFFLCFYTKWRLLNYKHIHSEL